jgi:N-acetylneuraminate synthase
MDVKMAEKNLQLSYYVDNISKLLMQEHIVLPNIGEAKFYHHKGFENFEAVGAVFIGVVVHDYCKFIVVMLPNQSYPLHFHRIKDESYFVLAGELTVTVEEETYVLKKGDTLNVPRRYNHSFYTRTGCVFEELSTAYINNDSVYDDKTMQNLPKDVKNTVVPIAALLENQRRIINE